MVFIVNDAKDIAKLNDFLQKESIEHESYINVYRAVYNDEAEEYLDSITDGFDGYDDEAKDDMISECAYRYNCGNIFDEDYMREVANEVEAEYNHRKNQ